MFNKKRTGIKASAYPQRVQDTTTDNPVIRKVCHLHTCLGNNFFRSITSHIRFFCLLTMHGYFNVFRYIQWDTLCASRSIEHSMTVNVGPPSDSCPRSSEDLVFQEQAKNWLWAKRLETLFCWHMLFFLGCPVIISTNSVSFVFFQA